jgi:alpha-L-fucosidase 2
MVLASTTECLDLTLANRNHWHTEQTGLGDIQEPLWDFMTDTWVPRGSETAHLLYDAPGWVAFNNLNAFGFTG